MGVIREALCPLNFFFFFARCRALHIITHARVAPEISAELQTRIESLMKPHHVESSMDFFNEFQQMITLAPGMRLVYRTNFAGMYNDISQAPKKCKVLRCEKKTL